MTTTLGRKSQWHDFVHTVDVLTAIALTKDDLEAAMGDLEAPVSTVVPPEIVLPVGRSRLSAGWIESRRTIREQQARHSRSLESIRRLFLSPIAIAIAIATAANAALLIASVTIYYQMSPIIAKKEASEQAPESTLTTLTFHGWSVKDDTTTLPSGDGEVKPVPANDWSLELSSSGRIRGTVKGTDDNGQQLTWEVTGLARGDEIAISRGSGSQNKNVATSAIYMRKQPDSETYLGYILGKRCKTKDKPVTEILVCPYMLSKDPHGDDFQWSQKFSHTACKSLETEPPEVLCG